MFSDLDRPLGSNYSLQVSWEGHLPAGKGEQLRSRAPSPDAHPTGLGTGWEQCSPAALRPRKDPSAKVCLQRLWPDFNPPTRQVGLGSG